MSYNKLYAKSFIYGLTFGKSIKPGEDARVSVVDCDDVLLAVKKAYIDMTPRTFKGKDDKQEEDGEEYKGKKASLLSDLAERICQYMNTGCADFEAWHKEACELVIGLLGEMLDLAGKDKEQATYGKAQKLVNMSFKYLYCFDDAEDYLERFKPCHMPIDSYILKWFLSWYKDVWNNETGKRLSKNGAYHLPAWSNLKYEKENDEIIPQYIDIQRAIKERLNDTPRIEAEFLIWWQAKNDGDFTY